VQEFDAVHFRHFQGQKDDLGFWSGFNLTVAPQNFQSIKTVVRHMDGVGNFLFLESPLDGVCIDFIIFHRQDLNGLSVQLSHL